MESRKILLVILFLFYFYFNSVEVKAQAKVTIKMATLAPKGSTMMDIMEEYLSEIRQQTNNEVDFKIYWGGQQGDEKNVLRKMRIGQLHGGAFTGSGLGQIVPEIRVTEIPFLFRNAEEVAYVRKKLEAPMNKYCEDRGLIVLGWYDIGFLYGFSNVPVNSLEVLRKQKCWAPSDDPLAIASFEALGLTPIPLSFTDVLTSVSTNLINTAAMTPFGAVAFHWYAKFKYMSDYPIMNLIGAAVVSKNIWDKISKESQQKILEISKDYINRFTKDSENLNNKGIEVLKKEGVEIIHFEQEGSAGDFYEEAGKKARESQIGKLYSKELLDKALLYVDEYRKNNPESKFAIIK
ncbi:MAG: TRAP transporter substrate-binding protein DctP [Desulfobacterales bacterium]|nr:TRAP transporter substrate-binding protein DctP [Desulfobacterales bacterium]